MPLSALHAGLFSVVPIALASIFLAIGWAAQRGQQRLARLSLRALQKVDHRAPVLFLRAFRDDQVQLAPARFGVLGGWLSLPQRRTSLDEILLEEGTIYGPVVALGNPTDRQPPYGAARAYLDNKVWQEVVADLASNSVAIVICVDNTDSIWWEVQHLADKGYLKKTLFLFHPRLIRNSADTEVAVRVLEAMGFGSGATELRSQSASPVKNESPGSTIFGVFIDSNGALQIARSSTFSRVAALITVRWFLRSRFGSNPVAL